MNQSIAGARQHAETNQAGNSSERCFLRTPRLVRALIRIQYPVLFLLCFTGYVGAQTAINIHAIQTDLPNSPYMGDSVTTEGIITAVLADGFYIENSSSNSNCTDIATLNCWDGSVATAEGIFVYTGTTPSTTYATVGYLVELTGIVAISNSSADADAQGTEIVLSGMPKVVSTGNSLPDAVPSAALASAATGAFGQWLDFEGMRIDVSSLTTTSGTGGTLVAATQAAITNGQFWGVLTTDYDSDGRPFRATGISELEVVPTAAPSTVARWVGNPSLLFIDSAIRGGAALNVTAGETITELIGIVDYHESASGYTGILLDPSGGYGTVTAASGASGTAATAAATGQLTIATQDLDSFYNVTTRVAKAALAIVNFDNSPDIVAIQEMQSQAAVESLVTQIASDGGPSYSTCWYSSNDANGFANAFLINETKVDFVSCDQVGATATYTTPAGSSATLFDRPPLVLTVGISRGDAADYQVVVVNSNLQDRADIADTTLGATVRAKRNAQAEYLSALIDGYQTAGDHVVAAGDYNSFEFSDGYVDTMGAIVGDPVSSSLVTLASTTSSSPELVNLTTLTANTSTNRYSSVENGSAEQGDHILVTSDMESLASISYARFGADFPLIDLNDATTALHASSHDGVVAYFTIPYSTSMTLASSLNPSYYGESVTFTATVTSSGGTPTGAVTFYDGATKLGTGTLSSGSATYTTSGLTVGSHTIKAVYGGSSSFESSSASLTQVVLSLLASDTALTCSPNPAAYGATVTCTATVTGSSTTPTGTVTFYDGSTALGTATLSSGVATYPTSTLSVGSHLITAVYAGTAPYATSTSNAVDEIILSTFSLSVSPTSRAVYTGEAADYTVTVTPGSGFTLDVALTCSGMPSNTTCGLMPSTVSGGSGASKLVVQTTAPSQTTVSASNHPNRSVWTLLAGILLLCAPRRWRRRGGWSIWLLLTLALSAGVLNGCSSSGTLAGGTAAGNYTITVTGTAVDGTITLTQTATAAVTVKSLF